VIQVPPKSLNSFPFEVTKKRKPGSRSISCCLEIISLHVALVKVTLSLANIIRQNLESKLEVELNEAERLRLIINFCQQHYYDVHKDAIHFTTKGLQLAERLQQQKEISILKAYQAFHLWHAQEIESAKELASSIRKDLLKYKCYRELGLAVIVLALIEWSKGNLEVAFNTINQAFDDLHNKRNKNEAIARLNWALGTFYFDLGSLNKSLSCYQKCEKLSPLKDDLSLDLYTKIGYSSIHKKNENYGEAITLLNEILVGSKGYNMWMIESRALFELGTIYLTLNKLDDAHYVLDKSCQIRKANKALPAVVSCLEMLAGISIKTDRFDDARNKLNEAIRVCEENGLKSKLSSVMLVIAQFEENQNNFELALASFKRHVTLETELTKIERENRNQYLKLNFQAKRIKEDNYKQRLLNRELKSALGKARELSDLKSRFVSVTSHQFRTPMAIIQSNTDLVNMASKQSSDTVKPLLNKATKRIKQEIENMVELMDDILILGRISEGNSLKLNKKSTELVEFCESIVSDFDEIHNNERHVKLVVLGAPKEMRLDKKLIRHALVNLLSNALKYCVDADPTLQLEFDTQFVSLSVIDKGIGIPAGDMPNLFQPFQRAGNVGAIKGTGLGLSISKEYVELHGGTMQVESKLNEGSTFTITLPN
jgi:signal transduction histidine kinase